MSDDDIDQDGADESSGGGLSEDWLAVIVGLGILLLALFGLIPAGLLW